MNELMNEYTAEKTQRKLIESFGGVVFNDVPVVGALPLAFHHLENH